VHNVKNWTIWSWSFSYLRKRDIARARSQWETPCRNKKDTSVKRITFYIILHNQKVSDQSSSVISQFFTHASNQVLKLRFQSFPNAQQQETSSKRDHGRKKKKKKKQQSKRPTSSSLDSYLSFVSNCRSDSGSLTSSSGTLASSSQSSSDKSASKSETSTSKRKIDRGPLKVSINETAELIEDRNEKSSSGDERFRSEDALQSDDNLIALQGWTEPTFSFILEFIKFYMSESDRSQLYRSNQIRVWLCRLRLYRIYYDNLLSCADWSALEIKESNSDPLISIFNVNTCLFCTAWRLKFALFLFMVAYWKQ